MFYVYLGHFSISRYQLRDGRLTNCPLRYLYHFIIIYAAEAICVATHVGLQPQLQRHINSIRTNGANGEALFEGSPILYIICFTFPVPSTPMDLKHMTQAKLFKIITGYFKKKIMKQNIHDLFNVP